MALNLKSCYIVDFPDFYYEKKEHMFEKHRFRVPYRCNNFVTIIFYSISPKRVKRHL